MKRIFRHELTLLALFILINFVGAALLTPVIYEAGKELAANHATPERTAFSASPHVWLAKKCENAEFSRYFNRALLACALILLYPLIRCLRRPEQTQVKPPLLHRIKPHRQGWKDIAFGLMLSAGFLGLMTFLLIQLGYLAIEESIEWGRALRKAIIPAVIVSLLEEWLFRGALYNVLQRRLNTTLNILALSIFFAAVHFLKPPDGVDVSDPYHPLAGFEMIGLIGQKFLNPASFFGKFLTLVTVGIILAYSRYRTGTLWLAIGLHTGWIFSLKLVNRISDPTGQSSDLIFNDNITDGLLPLLTLILTGVCVALYLRTKPSLKPN